MKKIFSLVLFSTTIGTALNAQIKQDAILVGGQFNLSNSKTDYSNSTQTNTVNAGGLSVSVGKAIKENTVVGVFAGFGQSKYEDKYPNNTFSSNKNTNFNAGVFVRKYKNFTKNFYFFGELNGGVYSNQTKYEGNTGNNLQKSNGLAVQINVAPGLAYQIYKKLQLEIVAPNIAGIGYKKTKDTYTNSTNTRNDVYLSSNLNNGFLSNLALGFKFVL